MALGGADMVDDGKQGEFNIWLHFSIFPRIQSQYADCSCLVGVEILEQDIVPVD